MAKTSIADVWTPDVWQQVIRERMNTLPSLISSNLVMRSAEFDAFATGPGITVNLPYFRDISDQADAPQVEDTQPTLQKMGSGKQIAPILNRESGLSNTALSSVVSGADVEEGIVSQLTPRRQKQRQSTVVSIMRGLFDNASGPSSATGALKLNRNDVFLEAGANPAANQCISPFNIIDTVARLGELSDATEGGGIFMHPLIHASLVKQDQISFQHYSEQGIKIQTYKGYRIFISNLLFRAGGAGGYVFDTYIASPGTFAWGEKPQVDGMRVVDVAALSYWLDPQKNNQELYDRTRFLLHPNGMKWVGVPGGQSASNAELATAANWNLDYLTPDRVGIVCLRTNG